MFKPVLSKTPAWHLFNSDASKVRIGTKYTLQLNFYKVSIDFTFYYWSEI